MTRARWSVLSTPGVAGALAVVRLEADDASGLEAALRAAGIAPVGEGEIRLRDLAGVDRGLVARWGPASADLMPHGGVLVVRELLGRLSAVGIEESHNIDPIRLYPEAADAIEARALSALASAASPLAVGLLLDQPRRFREGREEIPAESARTLGRLLRPPLVVAVGPANIGKSSLANALAGRSVAIVADEPGTTRDHVGVLLDLAGVVVRWVDTPGLRETEDPGEREARDLAMGLARGADLLMLCGDATSPPAEPGALGLAGLPSVRVGLRGDLGPPAWEGASAVVSARTGAGLAELAGLLAETLVPAALRADPRAWRFWDEPGGAGPNPGW